LSYLVDTNIASYVMRNRPSVVAKVEEAGGVGLLSITTVSLAELRYGIRTMSEGRRRSRLLQKLGDMLEAGMEIRPFTISAADVYAEAGAALKSNGIAISENKILASNDDVFAHMRRLCGLRFERWEP
jgi:toxin FitB